MGTGWSGRRAGFPWRAERNREVRLRMKPPDRHEPRGLRLLAAGLLFIDAVSAAVGVAGIVGSLSIQGPAALLMIAVRGLSGALEATGSWLLLQQNPAAPAIARSGVLVAAVYATLGIAFRLAPTNLDPSLRLPVVLAYWTYALMILGLLRRIAVRT
jgi:hypothetical protein